MNTKEKLLLEETVSSAPSEDHEKPESSSHRRVPRQQSGEFDLSPMTQLTEEELEVVPETLSAKRRRPLEDDDERVVSEKEEDREKEISGEHEAEPQASPGFFAPPNSQVAREHPQAALQIGAVLYEDPFYSDPKDIPARPFTFGGRSFTFKPTEPQNPPPFDPPGNLRSPFFLPTTK